MMKYPTPTSPDDRRCLLPMPVALAVGIIGLIALLTTQQVSAQEEESGPGHPSAEPQAAHDSGHYHRHHAGIFIGGSHVEGHNGFTLGGEYEFRIHQYFGAGAFVEIIGGDFDERVFGALFGLHPAAGWIIFTGPGWEERFRKEQGGGSTESPGPSSQSAEETEEGLEFLWRAGLMYQIPVGRMTISPNVMVDFLKGHQVFVYGVTLGLGF